MEKKEKRTGNEISVGHFTLKLGDRLKEMKDSASLKDDPESLRRILATDGYILLRNFLDRKPNFWFSSSCYRYLR